MTQKYTSRLNFFGTDLAAHNLAVPLILSLRIRQRVFEELTGQLFRTLNVYIAYEQMKIEKAAAAAPPNRHWDHVHLHLHMHIPRVEFLREYLND